MHEIPSETRTLKRERCPKCDTAYYDEDSPEFCYDCGQNLTYREDVALCPFCGEDLDKYHLVQYGERCFDKGQPIELKSRDEIVVQDHDGDFWIISRDRHYEDTVAWVKPIDALDARTRIEVELSKTRNYLQYLQTALDRIEGS
jgi:hypothetical protein